MFLTFVIRQESDGGRLFHTAGAAYENARCPVFIHVHSCL